MAVDDAPVLPRRRLRAELKRARQHSGLTQEEVASRLYWSESKVIRIENGASGVSVTDVKALLDLYGVTDPGQANLLLKLAQAARKRSPLGAYRDVAPQSLLQLIEYESVASAIRQFETIFVPASWD